MLKENKDTVYIEIDGPKDSRGYTPFTVYTWVTWTPSIKEPHWNAQCFRADLEEHMKRIPGKKELVYS